MVSPDVWHALVIFVSAFVLEDIAVLGAALLVVNQMISLNWAAGSSFAGIWLGDLGLYMLAMRFGRPVFEKAWFKRLVGKNLDLLKSEAWFLKHGTAAILLSRAVPGTRLPTYLVAGLLRVSPVRFLPITAAACAVWVAVLFALTFRLGMLVIDQFDMFRTEASKAAAIVVIAAVLAWLLRSALKRMGSWRWSSRFARIAQWEFWPAWLFYIPVIAKYLLLSIRYRSLSLPTLANPGIQTGGLIGESKYETLADLRRGSPQFTAATHLIPFVSPEQQSGDICRIRSEQQFEYPVVLKPDVGQRGDGFRLIRSDEDVHAYTRQFASEVLLQEYAPGPQEAGIFYYRFPDEARGRIFAITAKVFPSITGDGRRTVEELIRDDARASIMAGTYLRRFAAQRGRVLDDGEQLKLVEAGNHCQGAIFLDGQRLYSEALERRIDTISQSVAGFFVGRYDVRYRSDEELRAGTGFQIIELNGISSEATSIYDPANSLWSAYRTLFRQWEIVFAIAAQNRRTGLAPTRWKTIWMNWMQYRRRVANCPVSD